jgi:hypothetical protein
VGAGGLSNKPIYSVGVTPVDEASASQEFRQQLYNDLGGAGAVPAIGFDLPLDSFAPAMSTPDVADLSQPIVDDILKKFDEDQKAEKEAKVEKAKEIAKDVGLAALKATVPGLATALELWDAYNKQKEKEESGKKPTVTVEETKEGEAEEPKKEEKPEERADIAYTPSKGSGGSFPIFTGLSQERAGLARAVGDDVFGPDYSGTIFDAEGNVIEENTDYDKGFAVGGMIPGYAQGGLGSLQQYAVGGKLVNGAGDGMSDDIKANINGTQEARLADGEFVIPADVVSHLGNGSTDAGAKQLYAMMDRIRKARTGRNRQAPEVNARKYMPA